ncbi:unnamed protein product [Euphydryas editha]|uniref:ABC transporter domain-containing protein n=1 Tax=Euphydryas editha TaxID=104508 RepID=A0AAU9TVI8_EUPED|nr:unnamed protein product [Euphydryas editha]CAH2089843.1 unnamed protein product [Euphydryas editha]
MHLKRALGTGYRLSFTTIGLPNEPAITAVITSKIPEATVKETSLNSISYNLPSKSSNKFPKLFGLLESKRSELGINSMGMGISTLEEVFLKLCSDVTTEFSEDTIDGENTEPTFKTMTGKNLYFHQLAVLIMRQLKYLWSKKISFLIIQVLIPAIMIFGITILTNNDFVNEDSTREDTNISLDLDVYNKMADRRVLYSVDVNGVSFRTIEEKHPKVNFELTPDVYGAVLRTGKRDIIEYNKYLIGIELNNTDATVLFTTVVRHAAPVAMNLLTNVIATQLLPYADGQTVTTYNYPIESSLESKSNKEEVKSIFAVVLWAVFVAFVTLTTVVNAVSLPCKERASGTRHMHVLTGCAPALHWGATLLTHALIYALVLVLPAVVAVAALDRDRTIDRPDFLGAMVVVLMLGILSFLALVYIVSFNLGERGSSIVLVAMVFIFGLITPTMKSVSDTFEDEDKDFGDYVLLVLSYSLAPHSLTAGAIRCAYVARINAVAVSANLTEPLNYFSISDKTPGVIMLVLLAQFFVYMTIVILTQYGVFNALFDRVLNMNYRAPSRADADETVRAERAYVEKTIALPKKQIQDAMLVNDLHKKYWRIFGKPCNAVQGVSFSVKKGECFGLLGVNGAGKSSTFKMMTGIEWPTRGSLFANGHFMSRFSTDYLQSLGYCPQFSGLDAFLTGYDNLKLLLTLRGLKPEDVESEVKAWIETVGLEKYARRPVSGYSGGCARRLAAAAALSRGGAVTLLDEPTAGVDVAARRRVWAALRRARPHRAVVVTSHSVCVCVCARGGGAVTLLDEPTAGVDVAARRRVWAALRRARPHRAVVVTSHSMDEMEALCGRIAIMAAGRVRALGEPAELRAAHAAGHTVLIKLSTVTATDVTDSSKSEINRLKAALQETFNCTLRDEHKTMLNYHIESPLRYSELFSALEHLKAKFALFEDYSLSETTLEEVFLSLAREDAGETSARATV